MNEPRKYKAGNGPKASVVTAMHLHGSGGDTMAVCHWLRDNGFPWLIGDATRPKTLIPEGGGEPGDPGIWLDPENGNLVIRTKTDGEWRATYGDWVLMTRHKDINVINNSLFEVTYELI